MARFEDGYLINELGDEEWGPNEVDFHLDVIQKIGAKGTPNCSLEGHTHGGTVALFTHDNHICIGSTLQVNTIGILNTTSVFQIDKWSGSAWVTVASF